MGSSLSRRDFIRMSSAGGLGFVLIAACGGSETVTTTAGTAGATTTTSPPGLGTLTFRLSRAPNRLDPGQVQTTVDGQIIECAFESPAHHSLLGDGVVAVLAESWEVAADGLSIAFVLKEGIQFQGGYGEVTAEDVKFAYERIVGKTDPPLESRHKARWAAFDSVETTGRYSGVIHLNQASVGFLNDQLHFFTGLIYPKQSVADLGDDIVLHPIGTGMYQLEEVTSEVVVLRPFADWSGASAELFGGGPAFSELVGRVITDDNATEIALRAGELDFASVTPEAAERLRDDPNLDVAVIPTSWIQWLQMNPQHPKLADKNIREAIRYGIDADSVAEVAFPGSRRATSLLSPDTGWGTGFTSQVAYDPERAAEFLSAAGVEDFHVVLRVISTWEGHPRAGEIIQANLKEIGINVELRSIDVGQWLAESESVDAQLVDEISMHIFSNTSDPSNLLNRFTTEATYVPSHLENDEYEQVMEIVNGEIDPDTRDSAVVKALQILEDSANYLAIAHPANAFVFKRSLTPLLPAKFAQPFYAGYR